MSPALQIVLAGLGTYAIRVSAIALHGLRRPSPSAEATLGLIAPAVLAAIVADRLFLVDGDLAVQWDWWVAGVVTGLVAYRWRSAGLTVLVGMLTVWALAAAF